MGECWEDDQIDQIVRLGEADEFGETLKISGHEVLISEYCLGQIRDRTSIQRYQESFGRYNHLRIMLNDETPALGFVDQTGGLEIWSPHIQEISEAGEPSDDVCIAYWAGRTDEVENAQLTAEERTEYDRVMQLKSKLEDKEVGRIVEEAGGLDAATSAIFRPTT